MEICHISNQIAAHCDTSNESFCYECGANMYVEEVRGFNLLVCCECDNKEWENGEDYVYD